MTGNPQLEDLLDQYELARERGETPSPELLCQDCPELLPDFRTLLAKLAAVDGRLHRQEDDDGATFGQAYGIANPRSPVSEIAVNLRLDRLDHEASGGIGDVFRARDQSFDRTVAVKFLQSDHANDRRLLSKFEFEAVVTGRLDHPSIVPVHARGVAPNGQPYFVMRYLKGDTLEERIAKLHGPDGPGDAQERNRHLRTLLTHFVAACNAVAYAHSRSIVHRDLKPRNIKLQLFGETCVLDWARKHRAAALSILGSLVLLIVVSAAAAIRQAGLAASESSARLSGLEVSATFAAKTIGFEMDRAMVDSRKRGPLGGAARVARSREAITH